MHCDIKDSKFKRISELAITATPFICLLFGLYYAYTGFYLRSRFNKTYEDFKTISYNINSLKLERYRGFDTNFVSLSNILPYDAEVTKEANNDASIKNRFGGQMFFYEALNSEAERTLYYGLISDKEKYKRVYSGVSAYIILLTELSSYECQVFSTYDWAKLLPNYVGFEASALDNKPSNGYTRLKVSLIPNAKDDALYANSIKDTGFVSDKPITRSLAKKKCDCGWNKCTFAIKLK